MAIIEKLHVLKFRNLTDQYLLPNNNINLIIGQNGQGKTNLIESIYYLGHSRSFKTKNLKDIIPFDEQQIKITALVDKQKVSIKKSRDKSQILIDEEKISSNSLLSQILPIQIISPDRGFVVGGSPKLKRSYLDWGVFHNKSNETLTAYKTYKKTLKNINTLLTSGNTGELDEWFTQFASLSVNITKGRMDYVEQLKTLLDDQSNGRLNSLIKTNDDFTFQARMAQGEDMWGANVTFIEDDIILSSAHILGFELNKKKTLSCGAEAATKKNTDWHLKSAKGFE